VAGGGRRSRSRAQEEGATPVHPSVARRLEEWKRSQQQRVELQMLPLLPSERRLWYALMLIRMSEE